MSMSILTSLENKIIFKKYKIKSLIAPGAFGKVYRGKNITTSEELAIKLERKDTSTPTLEKEAYFLYILKGLGIPDVRSFGFSGGYSVLIMPLLGKCLEVIRNESKGNVLNLKDLCLIAMQVLDRIEFVHSKNIVHRDIKPENILVGNPDDNLLYLIDFGLAKKFRSDKTNKHISYSKSKFIKGTARFCSVNSLKGYEQSRRDDLESIGYILILLYRGTLPWESENVISNKNMISVLKRKANAKINDLCKGCPPEFKAYFTYIKSLGFDDKPDYNYLRGLFQTIFEKFSNGISRYFSWVKMFSNKLSPFVEVRKKSKTKQLFERIKNSLDKISNQKNDMRSLRSMRDVYIKPMRKKKGSAVSRNDRTETIRQVSITNISGRENNSAYLQTYTENATNASRGKAVENYSVMTNQSIYKKKIANNNNNLINLKRVKTSDSYFYVSIPVTTQISPKRSYRVEVTINVENTDENQKNSSFSKYTWRKIPPTLQRKNNRNNYLNNGSNKNSIGRSGFIYNTDLIDD